MKRILLFTMTLLALAGCASLKPHPAHETLYALSFNYPGFFITPLDAPFKYISAASFTFEFHPELKSKKVDFEKKFYHTKIDPQKALDRTVELIKKKFNANGIINFRSKIDMRYTGKGSLPPAGVLIISGVAIIRDK